jgi:phosphohistidine phosphatase
MKRLFIIRHAKAAAGRSGAPDIERPLTKKGSRAARDMARKVKNLGLRPGLFVSSPADRALETAHIFARELGYPVQRIRLEDAVYEPASPPSLLRLVRRLEDSISVALLFGHNPALQDLARHLVKDFPGRLPKMGILELDFDVKSWKEAGPGAARLGFFDYPGRDAEEAERQADDIASQLARSIEIVLERKDARRLDALLPAVERASRKIAREFLAAGEAKEAGKGRTGRAATAGSPGRTKTSGAPRPQPAKIRYATPKLMEKNALPADVDLPLIPRGASPDAGAAGRKGRPGRPKSRRRRE